MLLEVKDLKKTFGRKSVRAVDGVSFSLEKGRTLGIVGESGSGKTTLLKLVMRLLPADSGQILFEGRSIGGLSERALHFFRKKTRIIFQDPLLSLNPRMSVGETLKEAVHFSGEKKKPAQVAASVASLLSSVELAGHFAGRYPRELSGGECQRVAIARALSADPELLVCDEAVSALDVLARARILNLLLRLQKERGVSFLFVSHDLRVIRHMSDDVLVMKDGVICEGGTREGIFGDPKHPYTRSLIETLAKPRT